MIILSWLPKRKTLIKIHVIATTVAIITIGTFFITSLIAELRGDEAVIRTVKTGILYALPLLLLAMPALAVTGKRLSGHSKHPDILKKQRRMKFIMFNGLILISLAVFLFYRANYVQIDLIFLYAQLAEFLFGLVNLTLIGLNVRTGLKLSGRLAGRLNSKGKVTS